MHWIIGKLWPLISWNTLRCCHAKPVVSLLIRNNLTLWGLLPLGNAQSYLYVQLCLKSKKHLVAWILFQENFRHSQDRNTHPLCFFWSPVISGNTIKCHLYPPNVRFWPRPNRSRCLEKQKYHKHVLPPPKKKNENTASFSWSLFRTTKHLLAMRAAGKLQGKTKTNNCLLNGSGSKWFGPKTWMLSIVIYDQAAV